MKEGDAQPEWTVDDLVILEPQWLANLLSTIVSTSKDPVRDEVIVGGHLKQSGLGRLWRGEDGYPQHLHGALLAMLRRFEVLYPQLGNSHAEVPQYVVPGMLPVNDVSLGDVLEEFGHLAHSSTVACLYVKLSYMPLHFFPRLHARVQGLLAAESGALYRFGGVFTDVFTDAAAASGRDKHRVLIMEHSALRGVVQVLYSSWCHPC